MKRILLTTLILMFVFSIACSKDAKETAAKGDLEWFTNLEQAFQIAKAEEKTVLINFTGSDWCPWCWKLRDEVFVQKEFIEYAKASLILVELDFPRSIAQSDETKQYNQNLAKKYRIGGYPTILILNADGKLLLQTGYEPGGATPYIARIEEYKMR